MDIAKGIVLVDVVIIVVVVVEDDVAAGWAGDITYVFGLLSLAMNM